MQQNADKTDTLEVLDHLHITNIKKKKNRYGRNPGWRASKFWGQDLNVICPSQDFSVLPIYSTVHLWRQGMKKRVVVWRALYLKGACTWWAGNGEPAGYIDIVRCSNHTLQHSEVSCHAFFPVYTLYHIILYSGARTERETLLHRTFRSSHRETTKELLKVLDCTVITV